MKPSLASCLTTALCAVLAVCSAHAGIGDMTPRAPPMVDPDATPETRALFVNLYQLAGRQVMFGHQDDLAYGVTWHDEPGRSDVKEVAGSYPAVYGWEVGGIEGGASTALDRIRFGAVADFLDFSPLFFPWIFNIADAAISTGIVLLLIDMLRSERRTAAAKPSQDAA